MRTHERDALDRILAAAHIEAESQLPGPARVALRRLTRDAQPDLIAGICELVDTARRIGELEGLADHDNGLAP